MNGASLGSVGGPSGISRSLGSLGGAGPSDGGAGARAASAGEELGAAGGCVGVDDLSSESPGAPPSSPTVAASPVFVGAGAADSAGSGAAAAVTVQSATHKSPVPSAREPGRRDLWGATRDLSGGPKAGTSAVIPRSGWTWPRGSC